MYVSFYKCADDPKKVNKSLTSIGTLSNITINPTDTMSMTKPVLVMAYDSKYLTANYVYISEFDRYYHCSVSIAPGRRCIVNCVVDPLYTFRSGLLNIPVTVIRSESAGINYVPDKQLPVDPSRFQLIGIGQGYFQNPFSFTSGRRFAIQINANYSVT